MDAGLDALLAETRRVLDAGRIRVADLLLDAAATRFAPDARLAVLRARAALLSERPAAACDAVDTALAAGVVSAELFLWRAHARLALGDPAAACADALQALQHNPVLEQAAGLSATIMMESGQTGRAACLLDAVIEAGATGPALHVTLAIALLTLNQPSAAASCITRGLAAHPAHSDLLRLQSQAASQ